MIRVFIKSHNACFTFKAVWNVRLRFTSVFTVGGVGVPWAETWDSGLSLLLAVAEAGAGFPHS